MLDTSVLVAALRSRTGASNLILRRVAEGDLRPVVTTPLWLEYEAVLTRPEHQLVHGFTPAEIQRFLGAFASASEAVEVHFRWRPTLPDPSDEMVLEAAANGRSPLLITHNPRDFRRVDVNFGVRVITPGAFVKEMWS
ncbi:putative toxin-antitoxin system toxin component, PIN family [Phenylobacterium sp.]|uniref:putative toxin-antitoxin system toxin component, PIN family n=1 Tax=Phenylobacterium sp. TaxID=1871053 RepID=UPI0025EA0A70|nr:putative toxin-antitoxin system toxin component, PIN family [Phenylobacterium sp.]